MPYEMLTGAPPFEDGSTYEVLKRHIEQQPMPVRGLRGDVPEELDAVITRLLEKDPADRPATAAEVVELLLPVALAPGPGIPSVPGDPVLALADRLTAGDIGRRDPDDTRTGTLPQAPRPRQSRFPRRPAGSISSPCISG